MFCAAILYLQFVFVIFWHLENGEKDTCKMLVKLTAAAGCRESICMALCDSNINWIILERRRRDTRTVDSPSPKTQHFIKMEPNEAQT